MQAQKRQRYNTYSRYLRETYGTPVYRIGVDGGFSCPHRNSAGGGGCSYCDDMGGRAVYHRENEASLAGSDYISLSSLEHTGNRLPSHEREEGLEEREASVRQQVSRAREFLMERYKAEQFMLYFQANSNTYADTGTLKYLYDSALQSMPFRELIVSTRPDCINEQAAELLASYRKELDDVWVELGLQSANPQTLRAINRGHTVDDFLTAFRLLKERGIKISVHLILGLPGEGYREIGATAALITEILPEAVKIHNLHIPDRTRMLREYLLGETTAPSTERHLSYTIYTLERIPEEIIIQRVTCDTPRHRLAAPRRFDAKGAFINRLARALESRDTWQGKYVDAQ